MRTDRIAAALQRLDAEKRAILELHFWRVVPDEEIAGLLRVDPHDVRRRRREGVEDLCTELRLEGPIKRHELMERLRSMPDEAWRVDLAVAERSDEDGTEGRRRRRGALLAAFAVVMLAAVIAVLAAVIAAALLGGDEGGSAVEPKPEARPGGESGKAARDSARASEGPRASLRAVAGGSGEGTAQLVRDGSAPRLLLRVRGLAAPRRGEYVVWLYNAIGDTRSIGGSQQGSFRLEAPLPEDASRFRAIDISLEAPDGIRAHGGDSVLRVPIDRLRRVR